MMRRLFATLLLGAAFASACVPFVRKDTSLRVMVFNIHAGKDAAGKDNIAALAALIRSTGAGLVLLQEVDRGTNRSGKVDQLDALTRATQFGGVFGKSLDYDGGQYGIAALARRGFVFNETIDLPVSPAQTRARGSHEPRAALLASAITRWGRLQLLTTHLDASAQDTYRLQEAPLVLNIVRGRASAETPVAVGGDFNAEPGSPVIRKLLEGGLRDAWTECGRGDGLTYPADQPRKRIDYLFLTGTLRCTAAEVLDTQISDHRPLLVTLAGNQQ